MIDLRLRAGAISLPLVRIRFILSAFGSFSVFNFSLFRQFERFRLSLLRPGNLGLFGVPFSTTYAGGGGEKETHSSVTVSSIVFGQC